MWGGWGGLEEGRRFEARPLRLPSIAMIPPIGPPIGGGSVISSLGRPRGGEAFVGAATETAVYFDDPPHWRRLPHFKFGEASRGGIPPIGGGCVFSSLGEACHDTTSIAMMISTVIGGGVFVLRGGGCVAMSNVWH